VLLLLSTIYKVDPLIAKPLAPETLVTVLPLVNGRGVDVKLYSMISPPRADAYKYDASVVRYNAPNTFKSTAKIVAVTGGGRFNGYRSS
jgi:hypothetical protein